MDGEVMAPRARTVWIALAATVALALVLVRLGAPLRTGAAPLGILSFEFAHTARTAAAILASWGEAARGAARLNLAVDYLFLIAYATSLRLGCRAVASRVAARWPWLAMLALAAGWGGVLAGALDATENAALLVQLRSGAAPVAAAIAYWCASIKFALVAVALPVALPALVPWSVAAPQR